MEGLILGLARYKCESSPTISPSPQSTTMKKSIFLLCFACLAQLALAQTDNTVISQLDYEEDTLNTTSLNDIINTQELVFSKSYRNKVIQGVWKPKKYFTMSYVNHQLDGKKLPLYNYKKGKYEEQDSTFKSDWAVSIKRSRTIKLHKRPIADILQFGLEFSAMDVSVSHFKNNDSVYFNSKVKYSVKDDDGNTKDYYYMPFGSEMYNLYYGLHIGPSITIAPFTHLKSRGLANIRLQGYFTVGYRAAFSILTNNEKMDVNTDRDSEEFEKVNDVIKCNWATGLTTAWGIRFNWKRIGIGYEVVKGDLKYKSFSTKIFGKNKYNFSETSKRISLVYLW